MSTEHRGLRSALHLVPILSARAGAAAALPLARGEGSAPCAAEERA
ncbi:hypothetical protein ACMHYB_11200 [Sorangium sp. So ce1128]